MKNENLGIRAVCFGEVLWDNLPTGRKLGGAPLNVAYHLNKLGVFTEILSRVGSDDAGRDLRDLCVELGVPTTLIQWDKANATSTVEVHIDEKRDVTYEIVFPVAWDFIEADEREISAVAQADFFVFGSLSTRHTPSYASLQRLLGVAQYKVLDVNLRAPFYTKERILDLIAAADLVKMNAEELAFVSEWMELPSSLTDREKVAMLMQRYAVPEVLVTYGADGAVYHAQAGGFSYHFPAWKVEVQDTIGSGDSFLAAFLSLRCQQEREVSPEEILAFAATLSGFVTQSNGACPVYDASTINRFQWLNFLGKIG